MHGSHKVPERLQLDKEGLSREPPDSQSVVVEQLVVVEPQEKTTDDMRVSPEEESTDLPFIAERSKRPNTSKQFAATMFLHTFPKIRIVKSVSSRPTRAPCR